jgi:aryl-alcohol dehydrogenase-like predicted oxidoreductase
VGHSFKEARMTLSRRRFLKTTGAGVAVGAAALGRDAAAKPSDKLPTRVLGKTGVKVPILVMGGGSRFLMYKEEDKALEALNKAFDMGVTYIDTAFGYGNGLSEERVGKVLKDRRKGIFLATKVNKRGGDEAMKIIEGSLKRLQTDQIDLIHIHDLKGPDDLAAVEAKDGVLAVLRKLRDQKVTRFIGVTSHTDPTVLKTALERHDFDVTQMALNGALVGMKSSPNGMIPNTDMQTSFETVALPVARAKKMGIIAMKIFGQEALVGAAPAEKLLYYSLSLPVSAAVVGMPKLEHLEENVRLAKAYKPLPKGEMRALAKELSAKYKLALDTHFHRHHDHDHYA